VRQTPPLVRTAMAAMAAVLATANAQKYTGPAPPKPDLPYIQHAANLIATEAVEAKEQKSKDDTLYTIDGENSSSRTPLALPIFFIKADKLNPASLQMYRLESKDGHRELTASAKKNAEPIHVQVTRLTGDNLYKLDVYNGLDAGEYALTAEGWKQMFCFQVY
jgi:hypothetical protein